MHSCFLLLVIAVVEASSAASVTTLQFYPAFLKNQSMTFQTATNAATAWELVNPSTTNTRCSLVQGTVPPATNCEGYFMLNELLSTGTGSLNEARILQTTLSLPERTQMIISPGNDTVESNVAIQFRFVAYNVAATQATLTCSQSTTLRQRYTHADISATVNGSNVEGLTLLKEWPDAQGGTDESYVQIDPCTGTLAMVIAFDGPVNQEYSISELSWSVTYQPIAPPVTGGTTSPYLYRYSSGESYWLLWVFFREQTLEEYFQSQQQGGGGSNNLISGSSAVVLIDDNEDGRRTTSSSASLMVDRLLRGFIVASTASAILLGFI